MKSNVRWFCFVAACLALSSQSAFGAESKAAESIPAPEAWEYVRMTPEQRSELRVRVRALPKEQQDKHNDAVSAEVKKLPTWLYESLSNEMVAMEHCKTGAYTGPLPLPPKLTAWEYVKRVPHQRYHYRLRARALSPADRAAYEQDLAKELATLPQWLQASLAEEAKRYDDYLGLDPCARVTANVSAGTPVPAGAVEISKSVRWELTSAKGRPYRILISQPATPPPPEGYPVLYVLDANSNFGTVTETLRMQGRRPERTGISAALVVGIGYPTDEPFDIARRTFDYLVHSAGARSPKHGEGGMLNPDSGGGAPDFLSFINDELKPAVARRYAIDQQRQTLLGHSFGGFFTLYTLFQQPQSFQNYIALSPSVWWNDRSLFQEQKKFIAARKPTDAPINLFVAAGSLEETAAIKMVTDSRGIATGMKGVAGVTTQFFLVEGEDHGSIVPTTISRALRSRQGDGFQKTAAKN
ncbi:alpha/beta hydrolase [Steroidobacter sp.]|uniref:alpha/beta hydrolase n=1 Tax=Steroidobacter sp. TaxID=1978227 RepID=UPI001A4B7701|nr:alpha/beta hydrolase-fold protein [Steroidobacter sp.]MBL8269647.1 alpha/beta hydrolase [Steroidobacter sp.]